MYIAVYHVEYNCWLKASKNVASKVDVNWCSKWTGSSGCAKRPPTRFQLKGSWEVSTMSRPSQGGGPNMLSSIGTHVSMAGQSVASVWRQTKNNTGHGYIHLENNWCPNLQIFAWEKSNLDLLHCIYSFSDGGVGVKVECALSDHIHHVMVLAVLQNAQNSRVL